MTNGEKIKEVLPYADIFQYAGGEYGLHFYDSNGKQCAANFTESWWNAEYKESKGD